MEELSKPEHIGTSQETELQASHRLLEVDTTKLSSAVLVRLIEEVRNEKDRVIQGYNRFHNRHKRSR